MEIDLISYLVREAYILIPVLYVIGAFLKKIPNVPDWVIPWTLLVLAMIGGFFLDNMQFKGILQGVLVAGVTVFANQLYKQTFIKSKDESDTASHDNEDTDDSQG